MRLITIAEAAEAHGVSPQRVHQLVAAGRIRGVVKDGRRLMVPADMKVQRGKHGPPIRAFKVVAKRNLGGS